MPWCERTITPYDVPWSVWRRVYLVGVQAKHSAEVADLASQLEVRESELASALEQNSASQAAAQKAEQAGSLLYSPLAAS